MKEGDVVLTQVPQADGTLKTRPALILREMPPFRDFLVCGISTQVQHAVPGFDEMVSPKAPDFNTSGLVAESVIRLGFLALLPRKRVAGGIGSISPERHARLLRRLSAYLVQKVQGTPDRRMELP